MVSKTGTTTIRKCPFCGRLIEDALGKDINFAVHLGTATLEHQLKQAWADYVSYIHHI
jgi:hypothetical protein